jgi:hypothetical protein
MEEVLLVMKTQSSKKMAQDTDLRLRDSYDQSQIANTSRPSNEIHYNTNNCSLIKSDIQGREHKLPEQYYCFF